MRTFETTANVSLDGTLVAQVPPDVSPGEHRIVVVIEEHGNGEWSELVQASASSLDFWDNPYDDEDWNNA